MHSAAAKFINPLPGDTEPGRAWAVACTFPEVLLPSPFSLFPVRLSPSSLARPSTSPPPLSSTLCHKTKCTSLYTEDGMELCLVVSCCSSWVRHAAWLVGFCSYSLLRPWPCGSLQSSDNVGSGVLSFFRLLSNSSHYRKQARSS